MTADPEWGHDRHRLITLDEAWHFIANAVAAHRNAPALAQLSVPDSVSLSDATGRVLAAPVTLTDDDPPFDKAMMDGFAVRSADCVAPGANLRVRGTTLAGDEASESVGEGHAVRINTGAPIPAGADAVVRVEDTRTEGDVVCIPKRAAPDQSIARQGSNRRRGDAVLTPPLVVRPVHIAAAAAAGAARLEVRLRPAVAVVPTGNELVAPGEPRSRGRIFESNGPMLGSLLGSFGAAPCDLGVGRDTVESLREKLADALTRPVSVAVGGMSMGTHDLVPRVFGELGVEWKFHGVQVRPGKPVAFGLGPRGQLVFGLPGNPVSAFVGTVLFVLPALRALLGFDFAPPKRLTATLTVEVPPHRDGRPAFVPAILWNDPACGLLTRPADWHGPGDPFGLAAANALLVRTRPTHPAAATDPVEVIPLSNALD